MKYGCRVIRTYTPSNLKCRDALREFTHNVFAEISLRKTLMEYFTLLAVNGSSAIQTSRTLLVKKNYHGQPKWYIQLDCPHLMHSLVLFYNNIFLFA